MPQTRGAIPTTGELLLGTYVNRAPGVTVASVGVFCAAAQVAGGQRKVRQISDPFFAPNVAA